ERITYACATGVYPNSRGLLEFIEKHVPTKTPLKIIGKGSSNGIDARCFAPSQELARQAARLRQYHNIKEGEVVFSFIGRIVRDKGINELLQAFERLSKEFPCKLLLAGP